MMRWVRDLVASFVGCGSVVGSTALSTVEYSDDWYLDIVVGRRSEKLLEVCSELADRRIAREVNFIILLLFDGGKGFYTERKRMMNHRQNWRDL
jgi:hypothetical protein